MKRKILKARKGRIGYAKALPIKTPIKPVFLQKRRAVPVLKLTAKGLKFTTARSIEEQKFIKKMRKFWGYD